MNQHDHQDTKWSDTVRLRLDHLRQAARKQLSILEVKLSNLKPKLTIWKSKLASQWQKLGQYLSGRHSGAIQRVPIEKNVNDVQPKVDQNKLLLAFDKLMSGFNQINQSYKKRRRADRSIHRNSRERVYRLKGYTTIAKINRKRLSEHRQRMLRRILIIVIATLTIALLFQLYNPIKNLTEWYRIIGVDNLDDLTSTSTKATTNATTAIP